MLQALIGIKPNLIGIKTKLANYLTGKSREFNILFSQWMLVLAGRPGSAEVPRNLLTCWDVSSIPANGIFLTKKLKKLNKNAQRVEND